MRSFVKVGTSSAVAAFVSIMAIVVAGGAYLTFSQNGPPSPTQTSTTSGSGIQGVVTGYVTVGPSQPVCRANQTCDVNMTGYSLIFTPMCSGSGPECAPKLAELSPSGHYSILLPPGDYAVTGLSPTCTWMGCPNAFPKTITVVSGMQLVFDVSIDTGIR